MNDLLERAKKALIGKYFIIMHEGLAYYGTITYVRLFRVEYVIEIKGCDDSSRRGFYYSEEDMEALLAYGLRTRKDNKVTYILYSESNFISCLCKQVVGAKTEHTIGIDIWQQRWWEVFMELIKRGDATSEYIVNAASSIIQDAKQEMDKLAKELKDNKKEDKQ